MTATYRRSKVRRKAAKTSKRRLPFRMGGSEEATEVPFSTREPPSLDSTFFTPTSPEPTPIYSLIEDWNRGVPPSNVQLLRFLDAWQTSPILAPDPRLSGAGLSLVSDLRELGRVLAKVIRERNSDGLLQRFVSHLRLAGRILRRGQRSGRVVVAEDPTRHRRVRLFGRRDAQVRSATSGQRGAVKKDAQDLLSLGQLMISSTNFRQVIMEVQTLIKRALRAKPPAKESGEHPKFTTTETTTGPMSNFQEMKRQLGQTEQEIHHLQHQQAQFSHQTTPSQYHQQQPSSQHSPPVMEVYPSTPRSSTATANQQEFATTHQHGSTVETPPTKTATTTAGATTTTTSGTLPQTAPPTPTVQKSVRMDTLETQREFPESRPEAGARDIASSPPQPSDDEVTQLLMDAKATFKRLADNRNFRDAINGIYDILVRWQGQFTPGAILPPDLSYDANWYAARDDLLLLMERFASGVSVRPLLDSLAQVRRDAAQDYELMDFLRDWRAFLTACTADPAYMEHHEYMTRGRYLLARTSEYADSKYRRLFEENLKAWTAYMNGWQHDKLTTELGRILGRIVQQDIFGQSGLGGEERGTSSEQTSAPASGGLLSFASVQASLLTDLQNVILPAVLRELYELPLPHMDMEAGSLRIALDNVVLPAALFAPAILELRTSNRLRLSPRERLHSLRSHSQARDTQSRGWRSGAHLILAGMKGDINNVRFAVSRLAWPRLNDQGTADVRIGGSRGLSIIADVATDFDLPRKRFSLEPLYVRVRLSGLGLKFYGIRHETLFGIMRPYLQSVMKRRIERTLCERIVVSLEQFNRLANRLVKASLISSGN